MTDSFQNHEVPAEQWAQLETSMKSRLPGLQDELLRNGISNGDSNANSQETNLWKVMEGKVELSECFWKYAGQSILQAEMRGLFDL